MPPLALLLATPFLMALLAPALHRLLGRWVTGPLAALLGAVTVSFAAALPAEPARQQTIPWLSAAGVDLTLQWDGLTALFAIIVTGIGTLITIYSGGYLGNVPSLGRFLSALSLFTGSMLGVVLSDNLIALFVFWELTSISSYLLIGFKHGQEDSREGAQQALTITAAGGLVMLAGFVLLGLAGGSFEMRHLLADPLAVTGSPLAPAAVVLIAIGAFTKSAQFPFHLWLPAAMAAPTPVSAFLHSATMVKAGVFLLLKLAPLLSPVPLWTPLVATVGIVTGLVGAYLALFATDLKAILAYTTVSTLGLMAFLAGLGTPAALAAAVVLVLNHAVYKAALFMSAGAIDHATDVRELPRLGGLARLLPLTSATALVATASMAGLPPLGGFIAKELFLEEAIHEGWLWAVPAAAVALLSVAYSFRYAWGAFLRSPDRPQPATTEAPPEMWAPAAALAAAGLALGILPNLAVPGLLGPAAQSLAPGVPNLMNLQLWHGLNLPLAITAAAIAFGVIVAAQGETIPRRLAALAARPVLGAWYATAMARAAALAVWLTRFAQPRALAPRITPIAVAAGGVAAWAIVRGATLTFPDPTFDPIAIALALTAGAGAVATILATTRTATIIALGSVGLAGTGFYILLAAPDPALTQLLVEFVTVILFLLIFRRLPEIPARSSRGPVPVVASALVGITVLLVIMGAGAGPIGPPAGDEFMERSLSEADGRNAVNVILVDFRGFDTLGEITVLVIAGLGVLLLIRQPEPREPAGTAPGPGEVRK